VWKKSHKKGGRRKVQVEIEDRGSTWKTTLAGTVRRGGDHNAEVVPFDLKRGSAISQGNRKRVNKGGPITTSYRTRNETETLELQGERHLKGERFQKEAGI